MDVRQHGPPRRPTPEPAEPFRLTGEIDIASSPAAQDALLTYAAATRGDVTVDCRDVTFIDASGTRALATVETMLTAGGRRLQLVNVAPIGRTVLRLTGLDHLLGTGLDH